MWLIGVPYQDVMLVGSLLGQKTILNEFVAYFQLQEWKDAGLFLYQKSILMSTYILCGFANISSCLLYTSFMLLIILFTFVICYKSSKS